MPASYATRRATYHLHLLMPRPEQPAPPADPVPVERVGVLSRRPLLAATLIGAVVVTALALKPWQVVLPTQQPNTAVAVASSVPSSEPTAAPTPTSDPQIDAASSRMLCNAPPGWRLVSSETGPLGDTRTMYGTEPARASGPDDP